MSIDPGAIAPTYAEAFELGLFSIKQDGYPDTAYTPVPLHFGAMCDRRWLEEGDELPAGHPYCIHGGAA